MKKKRVFAGSATPGEEAKKQDVEYKTQLECVGFYGPVLKNMLKRQFNT